MATYVKKEYVQSDQVTQAQNAYDQHLTKKPQDYVSNLTDQLGQLLQSIQNRPDFRYDLSADGLYRQYQDQYLRQGKQAMADTVGKAAAMTGGYGNSYAQTAGQQTYQNYLQSLNDLIPQFYQLALSQYNQQEQNLMNRYQLLSQQEQAEYDRYQDTMDNWNRELERLYQEYVNQRDYEYGIYTNEQDFAYDQYRDQVADEKWQENFAYQQAQDQLAYDQWLQEFQYQKQQDQLAYDQWLQEFNEQQRQFNAQLALSQAKSASRGSGSSGASKKEDSADTKAAKDFVDNMLSNATSTRFDPQRVINSTSQLTAAQKTEAQKYLQTVLGSKTLA